jgi:hypothetical protein
MGASKEAMQAERNMQAIKERDDEIRRAAEVHLSRGNASDGVQFLKTPKDMTMSAFFESIKAIPGSEHFFDNDEGKGQRF